MADFLYCSFDTETTGKYDYKAPISSVTQPRILSVGAVLFDQDFREVEYVYNLIKPEWPKHLLSKEATAVHGITYEQAMAEGVPFVEVLPKLVSQMERADRILIFNEQFDRSLLNIEMHRRYGTMSYLEENQAKIRCVMLMMSAAMKLPKPFWAPKGDYKWPNLGEAYEWLFYEPLFGAHNAAIDARTSGWLAWKMVQEKFWNGRD